MLGDIAEEHGRMLSFTCPGHVLDMSLNVSNVGDFPRTRVFFPTWGRMSAWGHVSPRCPQVWVPHFMYLFNCSIVLSRYIALCTKTYHILRYKKKWNRDTILPHHDNFRRSYRITSSMKNTLATQGPPRSPASVHPLRWSTRLVWWDSCYFAHNCTVSTMRILLHATHHECKQDKWEFFHVSWFSYVLFPNFLPIYFSTPSSHDAFATVHF